MKISTYLVETMIKHGYLHLAIFAFRHKNITRMWVTVNETFHKDHFTI